MSSEETISRVKQLMIEHVAAPESWEEVDADYPLLAKSVIDSLEMLKLVSLIEEEFQIEIDDDDIVPENWLSIRHIAGLVDAKRK